MASADRQESYRPLVLDIGRYVAAQALVAISTLVALWIASRWGSAAVEMIYLPAVLAAGVWWGFGPAVLAAVTSALSYNYFFTEPLYTFRIDSAVDIVDVIILFLVAVVTSQLASAVRQAGANRRGARDAKRHDCRFRAAPPLRARAKREIAETACQQISAIFNCNTVMMAGLPQPATIAAAPAGLTLTPTDIAAAVHTLQSGEVAGHGAASLVPLNGCSIRSVGWSAARSAGPVTGRWRQSGERGTARLLESLLDQTALALTRARESELPPRSGAARRAGPERALCFPNLCGARFDMEPNGC